MQNIFYKKNLLENLRDRLYMTKEKLGQKWCLKKSNENVQSVSKKTQWSHGSIAFKISKLKRKCSKEDRDRGTTK